MWKLNSSPHDENLIASCYNVLKGSQVQTQAALLEMPAEVDEQNLKMEFLPWQHVEILDTEVKIIKYMYTTYINTSYF